MLEHKKYLKARRYTVSKKDLKRPFLLFHTFHKPPEHITYIIFPQVGNYSKGCDWSAGAQKAAVWLMHHPITLSQSILGEQRQCSSVCKEHWQPEVLC